MVLSVFQYDFKVITQSEVVYHACNQNSHKDQQMMRVLEGRGGVSCLQSKFSQGSANDESTLGRGGVSCLQGSDS